MREAVPRLCGAGWAVGGASCGVEAGDVVSGMSVERDWGISAVLDAFEGIGGCCGGGCFGNVHSVVWFGTTGLGGLDGAGPAQIMAADVRMTAK